MNFTDYMHLQQETVLKIIKNDRLRYIFVLLYRKRYIN